MSTVLGSVHLHPLRAHHHGERRGAAEQACSVALPNVERPQNCPSLSAYEEMSLAVQHTTWDVYFRQRVREEWIGLMG